MKPEDVCAKFLADYAGCRNCIEYLPKFALSLNDALKALREIRANKHETGRAAKDMWSEAYNALSNIDSHFAEEGDM